MKRIAIYPGSFDPPTLGHLDLIERAAKLFDKLIVAIAHNDAKTALFTAPERERMLREMIQHLPNAEVSHFHNLTVAFARENGAVALIRGLRVISDFEFELTMAIMNHKLNPDVDTVCLMPSEQYLFLSSRLVKEIARFGGDISSFVTSEVAARVQEKLAPSGSGP